MAILAHKPEPHSHWSKDYVEHLRTVHFTLVVVCLALVVLITSDRKSAVSSARDELRGIRGMLETWDRDWGEKEAERAFAGAGLPVAHLPANAAPSELELDLPGGKREVFELAFDGPNWTMNAMDDSLKTPLAINYPFLFTQPRPGDLKEFHEFWDVLAKGLRFEVPIALEDTPLAFFHGEPQKARFVSGKKPTLPIPLHLALSMRQITPDTGADYPRDFLHGFYIPDTRAPFGAKPYPAGAALPQGGMISLGSVIVIPVKEFEPVPFDVYHRFIPPNAGWRHEPFADTFPNLSSLTKNYEELDLETIDKILEAEQSRTGDSFEAIGIKFPAEGVTRWGIVLILGIQLYLFLHLHELTPKLKPTDEGWEVAWIGVYKSRISQVLYLASSVLLPPIAAFALAWHMPTMTRAAWWLRLAAMILGTTVSLLLGWLAWRRLRKNSA
jgi:hypothetical protein